MSALDPGPHILLLERWLLQVCLHSRPARAPPLIEDEGTQILFLVEAQWDNAEKITAHWQLLSCTPHAAQRQL